MTRLLPILAVLCVLLLAAAVPLFLALQREQAVKARLRRIGCAGAAQGPRRRAAGIAEDALGGIGKVILRTGVVSAHAAQVTERMLAGAAIRGEDAVARFVGMKIMLVQAGAALALAVAVQMGEGFRIAMIATAAGAILGLIAPDMMVRKRRARRTAALERGLPDALDMLIICSEAGLSLETAIERVTREIRSAWPEVAEEFSVTGSELRITSDRRAPIAALGARLGVECFRRLSTTLIQSMQLGTPLSRALRMLAVEMRQEQLVQYEARAAKLPVMLTVPMIVFIMPTVFLVVAGPAAIQMMRAM